MLHFAFIRKILYFYPRPPGGGRLPDSNIFSMVGSNFYPRPPGGGRRWQRRPAGSGSRISIHALRVEGDILPGAVVDTVLVISIHALRVEGDQPAIWIASVMADFYPRPPGGGRLPGVLWPPPALAISIHALRVEGDARSAGCQWCLSDFYPRPPGGGRPSRFGDSTPMYCLFLSTPSGWRATAKTDKVFVCFCAKGRRICLFKTRKEKNLPVAF